MRKIYIYPKAWIKNFNLVVIAGKIVPHCEQRCAQLSSKLGPVLGIFSIKDFVGSPDLEIN